MLQILVRFVKTSTLEQIALNTFELLQGAVVNVRVWKAQDYPPIWGTFPAFAVRISASWVGLKNAGPFSLWAARPRAETEPRKPGRRRKRPSRRGFASSNQ